ncbi:MAG: hypothetical protein ACYDBQ_01290 [Thermoplasmatota archaeon]
MLLLSAAQLDPVGAQVPPPPTVQTTTAVVSSVTYSPFITTTGPVETPASAPVTLPLGVPAVIDSDGDGTLATTIVLEAAGVASQAGDPSQLLAQAGGGGNAGNAGGSGPVDPSGVHLILHVDRSQEKFANPAIIAARLQIAINGMAVPLTLNFLSASPNTPVIDLSGTLHTLRDGFHLDASISHTVTSNTDNGFAIQVTSGSATATLSPSDATLGTPSTDAAQISLQFEHLDGKPTSASLADVQWTSQVDRLANIHILANDKPLEIQAQPLPRSTHITYHSTSTTNTTHTFITVKSSAPHSLKISYNGTQLAGKITNLPPNYSLALHQTKANNSNLLVGSFTNEGDPSAPLATYTPTLDFNYTKDGNTTHLHAESVPNSQLGFVVGWATNQSAANAANLTLAVSTTDSAPSALTRQGIAWVTAEVPAQHVRIRATHLRGFQFSFDNQTGEIDVPIARTERGVVNVTVSNYTAEITYGGATTLTGKIFTRTSYGVEFHSMADDEQTGNAVKPADEIVFTLLADPHTKIDVTKVNDARFVASSDWMKGNVAITFDDTTGGGIRTRDIPFIDYFTADSLRAAVANWTLSIQDSKASSGSGTNASANALGGVQVAFPDHVDVCPQGQPGQVSQGSGGGLPNFPLKISVAGKVGVNASTSYPFWAPPSLAIQPRVVLTCGAKVLGLKVGDLLETRLEVHTIDLSPSSAKYHVQLEQSIKGGWHQLADWIAAQSLPGKVVNVCESGLERFFDPTPWPNSFDCIDDDFYAQGVDVCAADHYANGKTDLYTLDFDLPVCLVSRQSTEGLTFGPGEAHAASAPRPAIGVPGTGLSIPSPDYIRYTAYWMYREHKASACWAAGYARYMGVSSSGQASTYNQSRDALASKAGPLQCIQIQCLGDPIAAALNATFLLGIKDCLTHVCQANNVTSAACTDACAAAGQPPDCIPCQPTCQEPTIPILPEPIHHAYPIVQVPPVHAPGASVLDPPNIRTMIKETPVYGPIFGDRRPLTPEIVARGPIDIPTVLAGGILPVGLLPPGGSVPINPDPYVKPVGSRFDIYVTMQAFSPGVTPGESAELWIFACAGYLAGYPPHYYAHPLVYTDLETSHTVGKASGTGGVEYRQAPAVPCGDYEVCFRGAFYPLQIVVAGGDAGKLVLNSPNPKLCTPQNPDCGSQPGQNCCSPMNPNACCGSPSPPPGAMCCTGNPGGPNPQQCCSQINVTSNCVDHCNPMNPWALGAGNCVCGQNITLYPFCTSDPCNTVGSLPISTTIASVYSPCTSPCNQLPTGPPGATPLSTPTPPPTVSQAMGAANATALCKNGPPPPCVVITGMSLPILGNACGPLCGPLPVPGNQLGPMPDPCTAPCGNLPGPPSLGIPTYNPCIPICSQIAFTPGGVNPCESPCNSVPGVPMLMAGSPCVVPCSFGPGYPTPLFLCTVPKVCPMPPVAQSASGGVNPCQPCPTPFDTLGPVDPCNPPPAPNPCSMVPCPTPPPPPDACQTIGGCPTPPPPPDPCQSLGGGCPTVPTLPPGPTPPPPPTPPNPCAAAGGCPTVPPPPPPPSTPPASTPPPPPPPPGCDQYLGTAMCGGNPGPLPTSCPAAGGCNPPSGAPSSPTVPPVTPSGLPPGVPPTPLPGVPTPLPTSGIPPSPLPTSGVPPSPIVPSPLPTSGFPPGPPPTSGVPPSPLPTPSGVPDPCQTAGNPPPACQTPPTSGPPGPPQGCPDPYWPQCQPTGTPPGGGCPSFPVIGCEPTVPPDGVPPSGIPPSGIPPSGYPPPLPPPAGPGKSASKPFTPPSICAQNPLATASFTDLDGVFNGTKPLVPGLFSYAPIQTALHTANVSLPILPTRTSAPHLVNYFGANAWVDFKYGYIDAACVAHSETASIPFAWTMVNDDQCLCSPNLDFKFTAAYSGATSNDYSINMMLEPYLIYEARMSTVSATIQKPVIMDYSNEPNLECSGYAIPDTYVHPGFDWMTDSSVAFSTSESWGASLASAGGPLASQIGDTSNGCGAGHFTENGIDQWSNGDQGGWIHQDWGAGAANDNANAQKYWGHMRLSPGVHAPGVLTLDSHWLMTCNGWMNLAPHAGAPATATRVDCTNSMAKDIESGPPLQIQLL